MNYGSEGKRGVFHQLLTLEAEGREGRLHREILTVGGVFILRLPLGGWVLRREWTSYLLPASQALDFRRQSP